MRQESQTIGAGDSIQQKLRRVRQRSQFAPCAKNQQVILLRVARLVVYLFTYQEQDLSIAILVISFGTIDPHVMICHDDGIQPGDHSCLGDLLVRAETIGIAGVHMEVDDGFIHAHSPCVKSAGRETLDVGIELTFFLSKGIIRKPEKRKIAGDKPVIFFLCEGSL